MNEETAGAQAEPAKFELVRYDRARKALAEAHRVDEVKDIRDKAVAMEVYARQAKDGELIGLATEIRKRAERRLGEVMAEHKEAGKLAKGGRPSEKPHAKTNEVLRQASLKEQGIDDRLADRARKAAAMPKEKFEAQVAKSVKLAVAGATNDKAFISAMKADLVEEKKKRRAEIERSLAAKQCALPQKKYGVIYADPEWPFKNFSDKTNASPLDHFPTSDIETIKRRDVPSIAADDCVLFLWATNPLLPECLDVMAAWGFKYKSNAVWEKNCAGNGYWFRGRHELLLVGTRGKIPAPAPGDNWDSVIKVRKGRFAEKPDIVYELIEAYFPNLPKIELNARKARAGWDAWGNEAPQVEGNEVAPPQVDNVVPLRPKERRALTFGTKVDVWVA